MDRRRRDADRELGTDAGLVIDDRPLPLPTRNVRADADPFAGRGESRGGEALARPRRSQERNALTRVDVEVDLGEVRGLGYYTGTVFETMLSALPQYDSVCSGGRYDDLVSRFSPMQLTGVGLSNLPEGMAATGLFRAILDLNFNLSFKGAELEGGIGRRWRCEGR